MLFVRILILSDYKCIDLKCLDLDTVGVLAQLLPAIPAVGLAVTFAAPARGQDTA